MRNITLYFLSFVICAAVASCGASKKARQSLHETSAVTAQADVRAEARQITESASQSVAEASKSESENRRTIDLEFDTTKPVDPATGTPPLKRATVTDTNRNSQKDTRQQTASTAKQQTEVTVRDSSQRNIQTEIIATQETEKKSRSLWWLWLLIGGILAGTVLIWRQFAWKV